MALFCTALRSLHRIWDRPVSPVHSYAEKLSDKSWLHIISSTFSTRHFQDSTFTADHDTFSHSLGLAAQKHPLRFAKLSLRFPDHCFWGYPYAVLNALHAERQGNQPIASAEENLDLICDVIRRFWQVPDINIGIAVSGLIESRASVMWPDDILNILDEIALGHTADGPPCFNRDAADIGQMSAQSLLTRSINCPQGCAINAIAKLLWQHPELGPRYKKTLEMVCAAKDPVVRYAAMALDYAYYNLDPVFSVQHFHILLDTDLRILAEPRVWEILWRSYPKNADYYNAHLISACHSPIEDLAEEAAGISCAIAIFSGDQALSAFILEHSFTPKQQNKICAQAVSSFNQAAYHEASKKILLRLIDTSTGELGGFNRLFFDHCIDIGRDQAFLVHLILSCLYLSTC